MKNLLIFFLFCSACCLPVFAQESGSRQIVPEEFVKARPNKSNALPAKRASYRNTATAKTPVAKNADFRQLGLTIWRLRPANKTDNDARIIVQEGEDSNEWTPERIAADTPMKINERIRFSFESPVQGYLYVIDREQYADGTFGDPYLIFPTTRTRNGDNQVAPGRIIEIPGQDDRPNFFRMKQSRKDQTSENLTVIVAAQPLIEVTIGANALKLSPEIVAHWEKQWGAQTQKFEMNEGVGKVWTKAEQEAGANGTRQLTQEEPAPQTIYRVVVKPGSPMLVNVKMRYRTK
jgi:hypothetical protein